MTSSNQPRRRLGVKIWLAVNTFWAGGLVLWVGVHTVWGDWPWWLALLNSVVPYFFVPLPLMLAMTLLRGGQRRVLWLMNLGPLLLFGWLYGELFLPRWASYVVRDNLPCTVLTINFAVAEGQAVEELAAVVAAQKADIVTIQELRPGAAHALTTQLSRVYPYHAAYPQPDATGLGVWSRYPLQDEGLIPLRSGRQSVQVALITVEGQPVRLVNVDLQPTYLWDKPLNAIPQYVDWSFREREREALFLVKLLTKSAEPVILIGDFNMTDQHSAYRHLVEGGFVDAFQAAGWGFGHTYPSGRSIPLLFPLVRSDYIFCAYDFVPLSARVVPTDDISDHKAVMATLLLVE